MIVKATWGRRWTQTRKRIYVRDDGVCGLCHTPVLPGVAWEVDHITPRSLGGGHEDANLRLTHKLCNARRGDGRGRSALPMANVRRWK
jgi:5-methylcytosine-specific restriction endonuclease McrA